MTEKKENREQEKQIAKILKIALIVLIAVDVVLLTVFFVSRGHHASEKNNESSRENVSLQTSAPVEKTAEAASSSVQQPTASAESAQTVSDNGELFDPNGDYVGKDISVLESAVDASKKAGQNYNLDITKESNDYFPSGAIMKWSYSGDTISVVIAE